MSRGPIRKIVITAEGRDQLIRLKRFTRIQNWNVLCRWALLHSLSEELPPAAPLSRKMSNIEMDWEVFTGPLGDLPLLLVRRFNQRHDLPLDDSSVLEQFKRHLHRGIASLAASGSRILSIEDLVALIDGEEEVGSDARES